MDDLKVIMNAVSKLQKERTESAVMQDAAKALAKKTRMCMHQVEMMKHKMDRIKETGDMEYGQLMVELSEITRIHDNLGADFVALEETQRELELEMDRATNESTIKLNQLTAANSNCKTECALKIKARDDEIQKLNAIVKTLKESRGSATSNSTITNTSTTRPNNKQNIRSTDNDTHVPAPGHAPVTVHAPVVNLVGGVLDQLIQLKNAMDDIKKKMTALRTTIPAATLLLEEEEANQYISNKDKLAVYKAWEAFWPDNQTVQILLKGDLLGFVRGMLIHPAYLRLIFLTLQNVLKKQRKFTIQDMTDTSVNAFKSFWNPIVFLKDEKPLNQVDLENKITDLIIAFTKGHGTTQTESEALYLRNLSNNGSFFSKQFLSGVTEGYLILKPNEPYDSRLLNGDNFENILNELGGKDTPTLTPSHPRKTNTNNTTTRKSRPNVFNNSALLNSIKKRGSQNQNYKVPLQTAFMRRKWSL